MHRYFFTTKDTFINSGSDSITGEDFKDKNTGQDEILELKKRYFLIEHFPIKRGFLFNLILMKWKTILAHLFYQMTIS